MVGYAGGFTPNPTYQQVCTGETGHAEVVRVVFDPAEVPLAQVLAMFWEQHDPTQGMKQGGDIGTQYRSAIYTTNDEQVAQAEESLQAFQQSLADKALVRLLPRLSRWILSIMRKLIISSIWLVIRKGIAV